VPSQRIIMPSRDTSIIYNHLQKVKRYYARPKLKRMDRVANMMHEFPPTCNQSSLLWNREFSTSSVILVIMTSRLGQIVILVIMTSRLGQRKVSMITTSAVVIPPPACLYLYINFYCCFLSRILRIVIGILLRNSNGS
jgi:hypothetical protein